MGFPKPSGSWGPDGMVLSMAAIRNAGILVFMIIYKLILNKGGILIIIGSEYNFSHR